MILGVMQPYFFPYLGYFDLINRTDRWIVFDTPQYIHHGWVNRNRILHPNEGWQYVNFPVKKKFRNRSKICDVQIASDGDWKRLILAQIEHYKKKAPYYEETIQVIKDSLAEVGSGIVPVNVRAMECVCKYLGITFDYQISSEMSLDLGPIDGPGDWALRISEAVGASEYVNPPGGEELFDPAKFAASEIRFSIQDFQPFDYNCRRWEFIPNLSIIDVMMWNSPESIAAHLSSLRSST